MTRSQRIYLASLLSTAAASQALAQSGPVDARAVRPAVMLLVDTSGSMERKPDDGSNPGCEDCVPSCTGNTTDDSANKTRWAMTVEALTGSFQNYTCRVEDRSTYATSEYDFGYYLPHVNFVEPVAGVRTNQATDGILDSFATRVKFGLMTFDGVGTTLGGETLVPMRTWKSDPAFNARAEGAPGMYSYGRVGRLSFPGCIEDYGVNAGARGPNAPSGALIRVGLSDNADDVTKVNQKIQESLLAVRPFGGTPIAAILDDLKYYLDGSDKDSDLSSTADPLFTCRKRVAILITDGAPDALFRDDNRFNCNASEGDLTRDVECGTNNTDPAAPSTATKCDCPYDPAETLARELIKSSNKLLDQLVVVAYNVHDEAALKILNGIGKAGFTGGIKVEGGTDEYPFLVQADGPIDLRNKLNALISATPIGVTSRSVPISVNTGDVALGANSKRFDITAGFRVGRNPEDPWSGLLFRRRVTCDDTTVKDANDFEEDEGDIFHESLNKRSPSTRDLFTATPGLISAISGTMINDIYKPTLRTTVQPGDSSYDATRLPEPLVRGNRDPTDVQNHKKPDGSDFVSPLLTIDLDSALNAIDLGRNYRVNFDTNLNQLYFGDANSNNLPGEDVDRRLVVDYVRGDSRRGSTPNIMADIYHSNPTALAPLNSSSPSLLTINEVYGKWLKSVINTGPDGHYGAEGRPGIVFVGTNDGVLHAFNLDDWYDRSRNFHKGGEELWGFVPPSLFGKMASLLGGHQFMFDGTPIVQDVLLQKLPTGTPIFRTMLLAAVRGEPSFVALDVTQPEDPIFMWQSSFPNLGNTIANPALAQVNVKWNTTVQHRAVAILPGGEGAQLASCPTAGRALVDGVTRATYPVGNTRNVRCWKDLGRSLYVVDVATGQLIQEFGPEHFPSPLTGSVVMDGNAIDGTSAAYFFDHDGVLWRLSMLHSDPREWRVVPIYDMFASPLITDPSTTRSWQVGRRPTFAPSLTHDRYGNLVITAGTGDVDSPIDTARQRVVSLTEYRNAGLSTNDEITASIQLNWQIDLAVNEAVTGPLTVFDDQVYWGTFESQASSNQCALGVSRIYGAHAYLNDSTTTVVSLAPKPVLVSSTAQPTDPPVLSEVFDPSGTNLLIGLTVKRQPVCQTSARLINSATSQSVPASPPGGGTYTLSGVLAGDSHGGELKGNNAQIKELPVGKPLKTTIHTSVSSWATYAD